MSRPPFEFTRGSGIPVSNDELLADLRRVADVLGVRTAPQKKYAVLGSFDYSNIIRRFGSWNQALIAAGLEVSNEPDLSDERLFENLLVLWQHLGRQPRRSDLSSERSKISQSPYLRRFGSWTTALQEFVKYANALETEPVSPDQGMSSAPVRRTGRDPSIRLRFKVMLRDKFSCKQCGASPAKDLNVELHVDHIVAWSLGGETLEENLQTLCSTCNLGKANLAGAG